MKILVLGGNGMAGHVIFNYLEQNSSYDLYFSIREKSNNPKAISLDLTDDNLLYQYLKKIKPDIVINTVAILNEYATKNMKEAIYINSYLPHQLASYGNEMGFKLIHISSDGVFSGAKGKYVEQDEKDATSIYAMTKNLGEVIDDKHLTIRTSIIGPEIRRHGIGLFHWFMNQCGEIQGYNKFIWSGITTLELAKAINWLIKTDINGLVHLTARQGISKHELLLLFKEVFKREDIRIIPNEMIKADKTLWNTREDFSYCVPDYKEMITQLKVWIENNPKLYSHYLLK